MNKNRKLWFKRIQDHKSSGLTAAKWCEQNGVNANTLKYYITKFNKEKKQYLKVILERLLSIA